MISLTLLPVRCLRSKTSLWVGAIAWLAALLTAWWLLMDHAYQPAKAAAASAHRTLPPAESFRIVLFAHPFCPCTQATLEELSESLARLPSVAQVRVVFVTAGLNDAQAMSSASVQFARSIPDVEVEFDPMGDDAKRHGATVSGEVMAFAPSGHLLFQGGITPGRGHQGDAVGQSQLEALLQGRVSTFCSSPIYGCRLP